MEASKRRYSVEARATQVVNVVIVAGLVEPSLLPVDDKAEGS